MAKTTGNVAFQPPRQSPRGCHFGRRAATVVGSSIDDRPVQIRDLLATVCTALGLDYMKQNMSNVGRPIRLVDPEAEVVKEALA